MTTADLKRTLRALRKLECKIRDIPASDHASADLIWTEFFSTADDARVRYPFSLLIILDRPSRKRIVDEYLETVIRRTLLSGERRLQGSIHSRLLDYLGLPIAAGPQEVVRRFHELAHELHPDHGGDTDLMAELLELYRGAG
jgi:hypothetical protein